VEIPLDVFRYPVLTGLDPSLAFHDPAIIVQKGPFAENGTVQPPNQAERSRAKSFARRIVAKC